MAEANFDEFVTGAHAPRRIHFGRMVNIAGGVTSVALVLGVAFWGYRLAVRDVSGVPVIQAMEGPMRIAPEDPGGATAAHLGLSVNGVAAAGAAGELPDRIVLAPRPVGLAEDDAAGLGQAAPAAEIPVAPAPAAVAAAVERTLALADELVSADAAPAFTPPPGAVTRSPRPRPRPLSTAAAVLTQVQATSAFVDAPEVDPATLRPGTRLVQLGAFDTAEIARAEWARIATRAGALMEGKERVIQPATSAGQDFFRLRAKGFSSEDDARRFCAAIEGDDLRCVPVTHR
ncbi:SPOR domain-containing protein [Ruixingdingia sedimenti]|uniref:SPOR domain-containing protein n=1 Tax=Ruixingdingia sedimenti TaxID=3073604 RepID=A0ABU1F4C3_9RHOB|nr:SPOR domain-containing protein [Xinfangfangia sp. LG-4]MDR5651720.1 SPOR domain-containing protein [Xinfangfangia sp. LG-4]